MKRDSNKKIGTKKMSDIKKLVLETLAQAEVLLPTLNVQNADYEGGYAYLEDYLRIICDTLQQLEEYDEKNCLIWGSLANQIIEFLDRAKLQYEGFQKAGKIPPSLLGVEEIMTMSQRQLINTSKKNKCTINSK